MESSEDPCEAEEHAVEEHDLQEQPKNFGRSRESMSPGTGSKLIVGNLELVGPFRQEGQGVHLNELDELNWSAGSQ
jgi:hypothetical protein